MLPVYILIRTSKRPVFFSRMMESIKSQTYPNIITIVHTDDPSDTYVTGDIIIKGERLHKTATETAPYNLYNNTLLKAIPDGDGWYCFIDDDDYYASDDVIETLVKKSKRDQVNVGKVSRWDDKIFPAKWRQQKSFQTECFFIHTDHKNKATWWDKKGGDHYYSKQLTKELQVNWIEGVLICKAQDGKGHGRRYDMGEKPIHLNESVSRPGNISIENVEVKYIKDIRTPYCIKGKIGETRIMPRNRAERLELKGKVVIMEDTNGKPDSIENERGQSLQGGGECDNGSNQPVEDIRSNDGGLLHIPDSGTIRAGL